MEIEVNNCNDCLFCGMGGWEGEVSQCNADKKRREIPATKKIFGDIIAIPKWCPLKRGGILVKLKQADVIKSVCDCGAQHSMEALYDNSCNYCLKQIK